MIIATYNEIENLPNLVAEIFQRIPDVHLLVIDDKSPDGTGKWAAAQETEIPAFFLISRSGKRGLGSATLLGLEWGKSRRYDLIATLDGDHSHSPADLEKLVASANANAEPALVVIGSRYTPGGNIEGWPLFRHFTSRLTNLFARFRLGLKTRDNTGAFRVYKLPALDTLDLDTVQSEGYAYLPELLWRLSRCGVQFLEVPITFRDRIAGKSKTSVKIGVQVFAHLFRLPFQREQE